MISHNNISALSATKKLWALCAIVCLLAAPVQVAAQKGDKEFKQGLQYEAAQQWERATEAFALAVAANPARPEYQLHYRRALFNASQALMAQGRVLSEQGDYVGAYNAFRRAAGYDPLNELASVLMQRALQQQVLKDGGGQTATNAQRSRGDSKQTPASFRPDDEPGASNDARRGQPSAAVSEHAEPMRVINYNGDLGDFIRILARQIDLNVIFDRDFPKRSINLELRDVTTAQALDHIFIAQNLFFQKLSRHTILVSDQSKRPQYQQLIVRTFYLTNADPVDAQKLIMTTIPAQAGRQTVIAVNKATNSMTVRDTPENMRLIGELIKSVDKVRAEVVIDVNIYEVSRNDLLQFGNQLGTESSLTNLGGIQKGFSIIGGSREVAQAAGALAAPTALGAALVFPSSSIAALQSKEQTRLLASTQLHAFDNEKSTAHIGQRVPVQTANITPFGASGTNNEGAQSGVATGIFGGNGYPVIQYEQTGLTLEFTPQVYQDLDVQVKMNIKSNEVVAQGTTTLTPVFTERNIEGMARVKNNHTMMIASVAQNQQARGRQGLPVLGLVPVLGQLFTAPRRSDQQTDIVIAVTPHVLRAPSVTPQDEESHPSGSLQTPDTDSLQALLDDIRHEDQIAAARQLPTNTVVEVPAQTDAAKPNDAAKPADAANYSFVPAPTTLNSADAPPPPTDVSASAPVFANNTQPTEVAPRVAPPTAASAALLRLSLERPVMHVGERQQLRLFLKTDAPLELVSAALKFDANVIAVRSVSQGTVFLGMQSAPAFTHSTNGGALLLSVMPPARAEQTLTGAGVLLTIEVEALKAGTCTIDFTAGNVQLIPADGRKVVSKLMPVQVSVQ